MNRTPETETQWEYLNGLEERELVAEIKYWHAETLRLRAGTQTLVANHDAASERLRAENTVLSDANIERVAEVMKLRAENAELRAANAAFADADAALREKLEWFEDREERVQELKDCSGSSHDERAWCELDDWEKASPKPGAGT